MQEKIDTLFSPSPKTPDSEVRRAGAMGLLVAAATMIVPAVIVSTLGSGQFMRLVMVPGFILWCVALHRLFWGTPSKESGKRLACLFGSVVACLFCWIVFPLLLLSIDRHWIRAPTESIQTFLTQWEDATQQNGFGGRVNYFDESVRPLERQLYESLTQMHPLTKRLGEVVNKRYGSEAQPFIDHLMSNPQWLTKNLEFYSVQQVNKLGFGSYEVHYIIKYKRPGDSTPGKAVGRVTLSRDYRNQWRIAPANRYEVAVKQAKVDYMPEKMKRLVVLVDEVGAGKYETWLAVRDAYIGICSDNAALDWKASQEKSLP